MKELSVTDAREQFPALLNQAAKKPVWITRHGVDVAVVISPELFEEEVGSFRIISAGRSSVLT